ncbi:hypothetical protein BKA69DRAFT_416695 [Paraphysoderma sedebokerense]|nr:hypothetical protein BKA69DRAFT_416695 [Paraphysoderma sedebokerense]
MKLNSRRNPFLGPFVIAVCITVAIGQITLTAYNQSFSMSDNDIQVITLSASISDCMFAVVNFPQNGLLYQFNSSAPDNVGKVMLTRLVEDPLRRVVYKANNFQMATTDSFGFNGLQFL